MILGENMEREENLEKKRKFSKEREKSQKKENFFKRKSFPAKSLSSKRKFSLHIFFSKYSWRRVIKHENGSIECVRTIGIVQKSRKCITSGQKLQKIIFSGKNLFWKNSLFFWNFSLSLEIFLFFSRFLSLSYFSLEINWNEIHLIFALDQNINLLFWSRNTFPASTFIHD